MAKYTITLIPGDGIGPEVIEATKICLEVLDLDIEWEVFEVGSRLREKEGVLFKEDLFTSLKKNKVGLKGPIITPVGGGYRSLNVLLRQRLDLYACLRPCRYYQGVKSFYKGIDLVVIRENSEDLYKGIEFKENTPPCKEVIEKLNSLSDVKIREDSGISIKPISRYASLRIIRFAFDYARRNKRRKVTCVHKANIMKYSDGLFLEIFKEVASHFPDIESDDCIVDNLCMQLVKNPQKFDCLVLPNLYGDIISDLCAGLVGGLGLAPGANIGEDIGLFEPVHGAAPKYKGLNKVNPTATILSAVLMLRFLGEEEKARILEEAVAEVIREGKKTTYDLRDDPKDASSTQEMAEAIREKIRELTN